MSSNDGENLSQKFVDNLSQKSTDNLSQKSVDNLSQKSVDTLSQGSVDNLNQKSVDDNMSQGSVHNLNKRSVDKLSQKAVNDNHGTKRGRNYFEENDGQFSKDSSNQGPLGRSLSNSSDSRDTPLPTEVRTDQTVDQDEPVLERSQLIELSGNDGGDTPMPTLGGPTVTINKWIPSTLPPQYHLDILPVAPLQPFQPSNNQLMGQMQNGESSFGRPQLLPNWRDGCMQFGQVDDVAFQELLNSGQGLNTSKPSGAFTCQNMFGHEGTVTGSLWPTLRTELGLSANHALGVQENNQTSKDTYEVGGVSSAQTMGRFVANGMPMPPPPILDHTIEEVEAPSQPRYIRNSLYDPRYEAMGLPIDPILRAFVLKYGKNKINMTKDW